MASGDEYEIPESGAVFTFGRSNFAENLSSHFFVRNDPVLEISCGDEHTALVCTSGRVFLFGKNDYGQLGLGHTKAVNKPSCLKYLKPFHSIHVTCGKSHTIISTACCKIFAFGCNSDGQLGVGDFNDRTVPQQISLDLSDESDILAVSAGCHHSAALTGKGVLFLWGNNADGQCGVNENKHFTVPQKISFEKPITSVSCGYYHTAFISLGQVYTFGEEDNGKLGHSDESPNYVPTKLNIPENCNLVQCGGNHTIVLTESGKAYAFGSNFSGQLGVGNPEPEIPVPKEVQFLDENIKVANISCGESHSAFITDNGALYTCGDARHGKLCNEDESKNLNSPTPIESFKNYFCTAVSCGGCHTMVLAKVSNTQMDDASENSRTLLPPLKPLLKKSITESMNGAKEPKPIEREQSQIQANDNEECDGKSNTESNLIEEATCHEDDICNEMETIKNGSISSADVKSHDSVFKLHEEPIGRNDLDESLVVPRENSVKKLLNLFRGKKASAILLNSTEKKDEILQKDNVKILGRQTSKACNIL